MFLHQFNNSVVKWVLPCHLKVENNLVRFHVSRAQATTPKQQINRRDKKDPSPKSLKTLRRYILDNLILKLMTTTGSPLLEIYLSFDAGDLLPQNDLIHIFLVTKECPRQPEVFHFLPTTYLLRLALMH